MKILFLCTGNSCRSQMAEGWAKKLFPENVEVYSAGTNPQGIHPLAIEVMAEVGIDLSSQRSKSVEEVPLQEIDLLVTLCGDARDNCPHIPFLKKKIHWPLEDPARAEGSKEKKLTLFRKVRDQIKDYILKLKEELKN